MDKRTICDFLSQCFRFFPPGVLNNKNKQHVYHEYMFFVRFFRFFFALPCWLVGFSKKVEEPTGELQPPEPPIGSTTFETTRRQVCGWQLWWAPSHHQGTKGVGFSLVLWQLLVAKLLKPGNSLWPPGIWFFVVREYLQVDFGKRTTQPGLVGEISAGGRWMYFFGLEEERP